MNQNTNPNISKVSDFSHNIFVSFHNSYSLKIQSRQTQVKFYLITLHSNRFWTNKIKIQIIFPWGLTILKSNTEHWILLFSVFCLNSFIMYFCISTYFCRNMKLRNGKILCQIIEKPKHEVKLLSCQLSVGALGSRVLLTKFLSHHTVTVWIKWSGKLPGEEIRGVKWPNGWISVRMNINIWIFVFVIYLRWNWITLQNYSLGRWLLTRNIKCKLNS